jgi:hypothetical protein
MITDLKEKHELTIKKYPYPSNDLLELVYPKFFKDEFKFNYQKKDR